MNTLKRAVLGAGYPGSGKGSHGEYAAGLNGWPYLCMGETLKGLGKKPSHSGFSPDDLVNSIGRNFIEQHQNAPVIVLDGWARNKDQAIEAMLPALTMFGFRLQLINWTNSSESCIHRLTAKPRKGREQEDTNPEFLLGRMKTFEKQTMPMVDHLKQCCEWLDVNTETLELDDARKILIPAFEGCGFNPPIGQRSVPIHVAMFAGTESHCVPAMRCSNH
jgi:adenylate kinase family enzyme